MQAEYYSDKSIAVFGHTKPWAANLKGLGGSFNGNLRGRPGWIFQKAKEPELMQFIANANAGLIQPAAPTHQVAPVTMVPFGAAQPAMTPQDAMARLQIAQPTAVIAPTMPTPGLPTIQPIVGAPMTMAVALPKPATPLPAQAVTMNYPNLFIAADGLQYQVVIYTAPLPSIGQSVTLHVGEGEFEYVVSTMEKTGPPYDSIIITRLPKPDAAPEDEAPSSRAVLINGQWKVFCMQDEHSLTFHAPQ